MPEHWAMHVFFFVGLGVGLFVILALTLANKKNGDNGHK